MSKPLLIAHAANSYKKIRATLKWADLVEVDVAQNIFSGNFLLQHQAVLGKFGIGSPIRPILAAKLQDKILYDLKHPQWSLNFVDKFAELIINRSLEKIIIVSDHWPTLGYLSQKYQFKAFYYLAKEEDKQKFIKLLPKISFPEGIVLASAMIDKRWLKKMQRYKLKVIVNGGENEEEVNRLAVLGIYALITNNPPKISADRKLTNLLAK